MKRISKLLLGLCCSISLWAQEDLPIEGIPSIQTDRPTFTQTPYLTPAKYLQFETGLMYERDKGGNNGYQVPTLLTRFGVNKKFELRLLTQVKAIGSNSFGVPPVSIGIKSSLVDEKKWVPNISFIGHIALPVLATENFSTSYLAPHFRFVMQHTLSKRMALGYSVGMLWDGFQPEGNVVYSLYSSYALSEYIGCYIEAYGQWNEITDFNHGAQGGFMLFLNENSKLDLSAGLNLNEIGKAYMASAGYSFRLNTKKQLGEGNTISF